MSLESNINVLHLIAPTAFGGAERVLLNIADAIDKSRYELTVGSFVNIHFPDNQFLQALKGKDISNFVFWLRRTLDISNIFRIFKLIRKKDIHIVHCHGYRADILGLIASRATMTPIISTVHGWVPIDSRLRFYEQCDKLALRWFDWLIPVSEDIRTSLLDSGINPGKVTCLHNAVDVAIEPPESNKRNPLGLVKGDDRFVIGTVGRLSPEKDIPNFLQCASLLASEFQNLTFVIVGDGPEKKALEKLTSELGLTDRVQFTGFLQEMNSVYQLLDVLVISSRTEGIPLVMLEAMKHSIPVVATDVGGIGEVIENGKDGFVVSPGNPYELAKHIRLLITETALLQKLSSGARAKIENEFDRAIWIKQIEKIYTDCVLLRKSGFRVF